MPASLVDLEQKRCKVLAAFSQLNSLADRGRRAARGATQEFLRLKDKPIRVAVRFLR